MTEKSGDGIPGFDLRTEGAAALEWVADYLEGIRERPVMARVEPGDIRRALPASPPERSEPFGDVLRDLDQVLMPGITHWQHPRFFSYFSVTASEPGILAELLIAALNQVGFIWRSSPASTELEAVALDWTAQLLGLPTEWHGHIEDTASTATLAAMAAARHQSGRSVVLHSEHAHSSVPKAARVLGMEARAVPTDSEFRMRSDALAAELAVGDAACVVATVGTTSVTSVDPVAEIADLCAVHDVWLHADAAYAGAAWVCPEFEWSREGVECADSVVVNPHKWLFVPADCSTIWTSRPDVFREAFTLVPEYLRTPDEAENLSDFGPALGRRFRSLKLWAVLRCYGREGVRERVREAVRLAQLFEGWVDEEPGWAVVALRHFSLVCFRKQGSDEENMAILNRVNESGEMFITHTKLDGRVVLRLAVGNARTTEEDVAIAWDALKRAAGD